MFYVGLVHFVKKVLDSFVVLDVMDHDESHLAGRYKRRYEPLVKLINRFQVHVWSFPLVFVN